MSGFQAAPLCPPFPEIAFERRSERVRDRQRGPFTGASARRNCAGLAVGAICLLALAIAPLSPAHGGDLLEGKSATGKITWQIPTTGDNTAVQTIWLWPTGHQEQATQLGGGPGTAPPTGLEFSKDDEWIIVFRHLSSGNFFTFYRKSADGSYVVDKEADNNGSDPVSGFFKNLKALPDNLGVERWSVDFEGWVPRVGPDAFRFGFGARLEKGPDGDFMRFSGWHGIYDLRKHAIVKTLSPGEVSTQTEDSEANLNRDYDQLRKALGPAGKKSLQAEQREWLKKRDALPGPKEKLELTTARITELEGRMAKKNP